MLHFNPAEYTTSNGSIDVLSLTNLIKSTKNEDEKIEAITRGIKLALELSISKKEASSIIPSKAEIQKENLEIIERIHKIDLRIEEVKHDLELKIAEFKNDLELKIKECKNDLELKIEQSKSSIIKWIAGLLIAQTAFFITISKLF